MTLDGSGGRDDAAGQAIAFMVAATIFVGSLGVIMLETKKNALPAADDEAAPAREAGDLAALLVGSAGQGWANGADSLQRLGLGDGSGGLDPAKIEKLQDAELEADPDNGLVDYAEARLDLGLLPEDGNDFHISMAPIGLSSIYDAVDLSVLDACYIGDWDSLASPLIAYDLDTAVMVDGANLALDADAQASALTERALLANLGMRFTDNVHMANGNPDVQVSVLGVPTPIGDLVPASDLVGSVLPDNKQYLSAVLPSRLTDCDHLLVGTGVDQNALTATAVKEAIRDWVLAGGKLMVLGSDSQNVQWMQPLFKLSVTSVSGEPVATDSDHLLLNEPSNLDWQSYDHYDLAWDIDAGDADKFHALVTVDGYVALGASKDGAFGSGSIILSTFRPAKISDIAGSAEATSFLNNIVVYEDRTTLYLEYGPEIPDDAAVRAASRISSLYDPLLGNTLVQVTVYTWST